MKISLSYLAIVAFCIGCVFSSCQSKVNKPSHNELDSTNTSVEEVDSAAIIVEQKRIEVRKRQRQKEFKRKKRIWKDWQRTLSSTKMNLAIKLGFFLRTNRNIEIETQRIATS